MIALSEEQERRIENFLNKQPDFLFAKELRFTLKHGWLEQESWLPNSGLTGIRGRGFAAICADFVLFRFYGVNMRVIVDYREKSCGMVELRAVSLRRLQIKGRNFLN